MKIERPLVVLDLETTGTWIDKDRIIEIGLIRCLPDGGRLYYEKKVNPGMPIPPEVVDVTGISNDDVKDAPYFRQIAGEVLEFLADADLAGFNVERFDLPLLTREFSEIGMEFDYSRR
ncbi:MAG: 3'-5' exonuclease, partial [Candidatus Omnitrophota bacterium]